jgi:hypothetical protein
MFKRTANLLVGDLLQHYGLLRQYESVSGAGRFSNWPREIGISFLLSESCHYNAAPG